MEHIISAGQFTKDNIERIFEATDEIRSVSQHNPRDLAQRHLGKVVATLFYEPSTRTRLSFESAAQRIGAGVISTENAGEYSSTIKGETLEDSIRTVASYADAIVLRHPSDDSSERAVQVSEVPVINAGAGKGEHPTQALLDLYTIKDTKGRTHDLDIVIGGDLRHGRTARSLAQLAALYSGNRITFVSTPELQIGADIRRYLDAHDTPYFEADELAPSFNNVDVIYWTRLQKERLQDPSLASHFAIGPNELELLGKDTMIMHPLPRNDEISPAIDTDPRAKYFDQVKNGLYIRMALLDMLLRKQHS